MSVNVSLKHSILIFICAFLCAAGIAFVANYYLDGPRLGPHYDFLVELQKPASVPHEILIIETPEYMEGGDILTVLMTLTEMDAASLVVTGRVSPSSTPITFSETEIRRRFSEEYILLGSNIRNLFEAIRMGSVTPVQAPVFVDWLVGLSEQGRDRLLMMLVDKDENLLRSIAAFGDYLEVNTKPLLDKDGKLRRVQPIDPETLQEDPVFANLKNRYAVSQVETTDLATILWLRGLDDTETDIYMDRDGNIITSWNCNFRRVDVSLFREYEEAGRLMRVALEQADEIGAFSKILPENSPIFLDDYAFVLREEMLKTPNNVMRTAWRDARASYFNSLDEFLNGQAEAVLIGGYDDVIADEVSLKPEGIATLKRLRDELMWSFFIMREEYAKLLDIRSKLEEELKMAYCILGSDVNAEYSALLANALITGSHIKPAYNLYVLFWSIVAAFVVLMITFLFRPVPQLVIGIILSVLAAAVFGGLFIFLSYWIDPMVAFVSSFSGTLIIFFSKCAIINSRARHFRAAYGTAVSKNVLDLLIKQGRPLLSEVNVSRAVVIAVKDSSLLNRENRERAQEAGGAKKMFYTAVKKVAFKVGAVVAGFECDTVLVCFGTPLDRTVNPVERACSFVRALMKIANNTWRFGIDTGECAFSWSQETGYSASGRPAIRARVLVSRTARLQTRVLFTEAVWEQTKIKSKKVDALADGEPIYDFA
jgi:class 3 adenylate cyclase